MVPRPAGALVDSLWVTLGPLLSFPTVRTADDVNVVQNHLSMAQDGALSSSSAHPATYGTDSLLELSALSRTAALFCGKAIYSL